MITTKTMFGLPGFKEIEVGGYKDVSLNVVDDSQAPKEIRTSRICLIRGEEIYVPLAKLSYKEMINHPQGVVFK